MHTQRINTYIGQNGKAVYYIEEYSHQVNAWITVGDVYESFALAEATVNHFNMGELANRVAALVA